MDIKDYVAQFPGFPKKEICFKDVSPILASPEAFRYTVDLMVASIKKYFKSTEVIVAVDARGFVFGAPVAYVLGLPLVMARKKGKLPGKVITGEYSLEYGTDQIEIQEKWLKGKKALIIDDLFATGGTVNCIADIIKKAGGEAIGAQVVIELNECNGRGNINGLTLNSLVTYY